MNFLPDYTELFPSPEDNIIPNQHREKTRCHTSGK